ncbi:hypothetical protein OXX79_004021 [Metschnikowia pulcherrima]
MSELTEQPTNQPADPSVVTEEQAEQAEQQAEQAEQQAVQQNEEDEQLPETIGEDDIEGEGAGEIAEDNAEPVEEDATRHMSDDDFENADFADIGETAAESAPQEEYDENNLFSMKLQKEQAQNQTRKKNIRRSNADEPSLKMEAENPMEYAQYDDNGIDYSNEDPAARKRRLLEEKMDQAVKSRTVKRRRADEDDLERMQDDRIDYLKNKMIEAANMDVEKNSQGQIATEKLKLLREVMDTMSKADLAISILDNNLLEAVRLWLEPLPDASMPAYQIQKDLLQSLTSLPIKTDHLVASGIGKVLVFYQRSNRTEPNLKKIVDKLIGEWTRPILNKSDSYKDRTIKFNDYNKAKFSNKLSSQRNKAAEPKSLYEQQAERRNRAAIPSARTTAYKIAPKVDPSLLMRSQKGTGEMFNRINRKMTNSRKKVVKKSGPSIEGKNLSM